MGADNWRFCPQCFKKNHKIACQELEKAKADYGFVSVVEFEANMKKARKPFVAPDTMREDYDIGIDENDNFYMSYKAYCAKCGFTYNHKLEKFNVFNVFNVFNGKGEKKS